jgi:hypothetical protein
VTALGPQSTPLRVWLERHSAKGPPALRDRVADYAAATVSLGTTLSESLARAGSHALHRALEQPNDRSAALDLLAADALVTLGLLAQAEQAPAGLARFAAQLVESHRAGS